MWPKYLDLTDEQCHAILRRLELDAYSSVVSVFRAQGKLTKERRKTLQDLSNLLNVPIERHKAEVRRSINDELLNTVAASVCGPNSEHEWAREGRRIIPLLKRASAVTSLTEVSNTAKLDIQSNNKILLPPLQTKTFLNPQNRDESSREQFVNKKVDSDCINFPAPASSSLDDMMVKIKGNDGIQRICVRPPSVSVPAPPASYKTHKSYFGGDIVTLPSGMIIRVKEEPKVDEAGSSSKENVGKISSRRSEDARKSSLNNGRKRKLSQKRRSMEERESKVSSYEVLQTPNGSIASNTGQSIQGAPWSNPHQHYPALVQQLYHQLYQMQQQLQQSQPYNRSPASMPPPLPPSGQATGEAYNPATGQYLSFQQLSTGKGKDRTAMMGLGQGNSHSKTPGSTRGMIKAKRTPGTGRGRRAKNGDVRTTKKQQAYPIPAPNLTPSETANLAIASDDLRSTQFVETRINNADEKSSFDSDSGTELRNLAENVGSIESEISDESGISISGRIDQSQASDVSSKTDLDLSVDKSPLSKKLKGAKTVISNQQTTKQQPHIIRHHAISHTQNLQLISSTATSHKPKPSVSHNSITPSSSRPNQSTSVTGISVASPKGQVSVNLTNTGPKEGTYNVSETMDELEGNDDTVNSSQPHLGNVVGTKVILGTGTGTQIKLKDMAPSTTSIHTVLASSTAATIAQTTSVGASQIISSSSGKQINPAILTGMKVIPAVPGARILPKLTSFSAGLPSGTTGATLQATGSVGTPIYMVATPGPGGQNVMRVARTLPPGSVGATATLIGGSPTTQRVVTLNASNLKAASSLSAGASLPPLSSVPMTTGSNTLPLISGSTIRTIQPRSIVQTSGIGCSSINVSSKCGTIPSKPSVIVVQRGLPQHLVSSTKGAVPNKDIISGQRIIQTKVSTSGSVTTGSSNFLGKPIVIVTKAPATSITTASSSSTSNLTAQDKSAASQGNVIVLDLSQDQLAAVSNAPTGTTGNNSILSDIIQATGIMPNSDMTITDDNGTEQTMYKASDHLKSSNAGHEESTSDSFGIERESSGQMEENGDVSDAWKPLIVETSTLPQKTGQKLFSSGKEQNVIQVSSKTMKESSYLLHHSEVETVGNNISNKTAARESSATPSMKTITNIHNNGAKPKPFDIVSAAFADAELESFDPSDVDVEDGRCMRDGNENNEVLSTDILSAAEELADHKQESLGNTFSILDNNSSSHLKQDRPSSSELSSVRNSAYGFHTGTNEQFRQNNADIRSDFVNHHANDDNAMNADQQSPSKVVIRSAALTQQMQE